MNGEKWKTAALSTVLEKIIDYRGKAPPKAEAGIRLITARNVRFGQLDLSHAEFIDEARYETWMNRGRPCENDILFTTEAPLANACMYPADGKFALGQRIIALRPDPTKLDSNYLLNFLLSSLGQGLIDKRSSGTTAKGIKSKEFVKIQLPLPPLDEQRKFGSILATWDRAIETVEALTANVRAQKLALMQQLLPQGTTPPKKRLSGCDGIWTLKKIGEVAEISVGASKSQFIEENGRFMIVDMGSVTREGRLTSNKPTNVSADMLDIGDLIMPKDDIGGGNIIGRTAKINEANRYVLGDHVYRLKSREGFSYDYLHHAINSSSINRTLRRRANGTAQLGLGKKDVQQTMLCLPDLAEQFAIASIIMDADNEILHLEYQLTALRQEKAALMQQLLTGKRRVKVDGETA